MCVIERNDSPKTEKMVDKRGSAVLALLVPDRSHPPCARARCHATGKTESTPRPALPRSARCLHRGVVLRVKRARTSAGAWIFYGPLGMSNLFVRLLSVEDDPHLYIRLRVSAARSSRQGQSHTSGPISAEAFGCRKSRRLHVGKGAVLVIR